MIVRALDIAAYRIPTDRPEADGTFEWDSTTVLVVQAEADSGLRGLGYSYTAAAAGALIRERLEEHVVGRDVEALSETWQAMVGAVRNVGLPGIAATAISAVDMALWDLKARALGTSMTSLLPRWRDEVDLYASGGFTTYADRELVDEACRWAAEGFRRVKIKVGGPFGPARRDDVARVRAVRRALGDDVEVFVDANGTYSPKEATRLANAYADAGATYFEEPVPSDRPGDLAFVRAHAPIDIAAGEYAYRLGDFRELIGADSVDILQADATRCLGITGFLAGAALAHVHGMPLSTHTAQAVHAHLACAAPTLVHVEYFHDHARIEEMLFDGVPAPAGGRLRPDRDCLGLGLELKAADAERWRIA